MSEIKGGGSAFPLSVAISPAGDEHIGYQGMSLRDYFAAKAMQGWIATFADGIPNKEHTAKLCYDLADAMLTERAK